MTPCTLCVFKGCLVWYFFSWTAQGASDKFKLRTYYGHVWSLHVLPLSTWVLLFLLPTVWILNTWIGDSTLAVGVNISANGCLFPRALCWTGVPCLSPKVNWDKAKPHRDDYSQWMDGTCYRNTATKLLLHYDSVVCLLFVWWMVSQCVYWLLTMIMLIISYSYSVSDASMR